MKLVNRKVFWVALLSLALVAAAMALRLFPQAMPMLQINMSMSRDQALAAAESLQAQRFAALRSTRAVARFEQDGSLQNYIELEGGGVKAFGALLGQRFISPYYWTVRRFAESQEDELSVRFTPEGHAYGFVRKLPEKAPGAALNEPAARVLAESGAAGLLGADLWAAYKPLSASQITRPGGRIDHSFEYEHSAEKRGEARFRLKLVVAGDSLVEVTPYAFVPQAFAQRFVQLRDGNEAIAKVASIAVIILFGLGGLLGGWLWLARRSALAWHSALRAGALVGLLLAAALLSNLSLKWFDYVTTDSVNSFLARQGATALAVVVGTTLILGLVFAVADGLSRHAFALHPRIFSLWRVAGAASPQALGRTLGGYAWMGIELLLVVGFYLVARTQWGWWLPAESLSDPNIVAAWRPALEPIANALQAGTLEEALFRAVPLAGAALLGQWLGWRRSVIAVALVLQALVFAGAHASYPGLPSYSRVFELFLPAVVWGLIFLRYGLLPCIVMHFTFDLMLMSLPLFVASDSRLWLDRALVLLAGLLPLLMVARGRFKQGFFAELPDELRYGLVASPPRAQALSSIEPQAQLPLPTHAAWPWWLRRNPLLVAALFGALALALWRAPVVSTPVFTLDRASAIALVQNTLAARGVQLDEGWKRMATVVPVAENDAAAVKFVWREAGSQMFSSLFASGDLSAQRWKLTYRRVSGPVEERAEEWEVAMNGQGEVLGVFHLLPEGRPGARLDREQALERARNFIGQQKALANRPWKLALVQETEHPARRDWILAWDDKSTLNVKGGSTRLWVNVRGDEVDAWRRIFVPDDWQRAQKEIESAKKPFAIGAGISAVALLLLILTTALRQVAQARLHWRQGLTWAAVFFAVSMAAYALAFDHKAMGFNVAQDWRTQVITGAALAGAGYLFGAALLGLLVMRLHSVQRPSGAGIANDMLRGFGLALLVHGVAAVLRHFLPENNPGLPGVGTWDLAQPLLATALNAASDICLALVSAALAVSVVHFCSTRRRALLLGALAAVLTVSFVLASETCADTILMLTVMLLTTLTLWTLARRGELGVLIAFFGMSVVVKQTQTLAMPIASASMHAAVASTVAIGLTWWALRYGTSLGRE